MGVSARGRWLVYAAAFATTLAAGRWAGGQDQPSEGPSAKAAPVVEPAAPVIDRPRLAEPRSAPTAGDVRLERLQRRPHGAPAASLFGKVEDASPADVANARAGRQAAPIARTQAPADVPAFAPPPPPRPQAPPLPFTLVGRWEEDGRQAVLLQSQDRAVVAAPGETVDGVYRIERVEENGVVLTYLPLSVQQRLAAQEPDANAGPRGTPGGGFATPAAPFSSMGPRPSMAPTGPGIGPLPPGVGATGDSASD